MSEGHPCTASLSAMLRVGVILACLTCAATAHAQGEGPRAYELTPADSQALNVYGMFSHGNASFNPGSVVRGGVEIVVNGSIVEYAHGFALAGEAGSLIVSLPFGEARRSVNNSSTMRVASSSGIGDLQVTAAFGLAGSPALDAKDYESYRPRLAASLLTRLYSPTGVYDRNSPVNLGQNRWALQLGLPLAYYLGDTYLDPSLTSFELIPSVIAYGANDEPAQGNRSSQAALMQLEGHITRNLNQAAWVSLDGLLIDGGETTTDGVSDRNRQRSFALGATVSVALGDTVSTTLSYTDEVSRNNSGVRGHAIRVIAEFSL